MSVASSGTSLVFCEGRPSSMDAQLLNRMIPTSSTLVVPVGGKRGMRAFIEGRLSVHSKLPSYIGFRDRDFDSEPPDQDILIKPEAKSADSKPIYLSRLACVESYFLEAGLLHTYWAKHQDSPKWQHGGVPEEESIASWVEQAARKIAPYQAVRWALASLKPGERWPELRTTWTKGSGSLPTNLEYDECLAKALKLVAKYQADTATVSLTHLKESAVEYHSRFEMPEFWSEKQFFLWFHGKDMMKALHKAKPKWISLRHYCEWAVGRLNWSKFGDLSELHQLLNQDLKR
ncbi:MAG: hypothetical protein ACE5GE_12455 [Phycisphaerae bacterium]